MSSTSTSSCCPMTVLGWGQPGGKFRETTGRELWGENYRDVLVGGKDEDKLDVALFIAVPEEFINAATQLPQRDLVRIIDHRFLQNLDAGEYCYLQKDRIKKVMILRKDEHLVAHFESGKGEDAAHFTTQEMEIAWNRVDESIAKHEVLVVHFTSIPSAQKILEHSSNGLRVSRGQADGGLAVAFVDCRSGSNRNHSELLMQALNELRVAGQLFDIVFVDATGNEAKAHRAVLSAMCSEFENLLNQSPGAKELKAKPPPLKMQLKVLHPAFGPVQSVEVESLLRFIYTGIISVSSSAVPRMLVLCHVMGVRGCLTESMRARIDPKMAVELFALCVGRPKKTADKREKVWDGSGDPEPVSPSLAGLLKRSQSLLIRCFDRATDAPENLGWMDERTLMWLIRQDNLYVRDEAQVFEAVLNWAEAPVKGENRASSLTMKRVFSGVRFSYMAKESISKGFWRLSRIVGVKKIDVNADKMMAEATGDSLTTPDPALRSPPRPYYFHRHRVVVMGGCLGHGGSNSAQIVSNQLMMWMAHPPAWEVLTEDMQRASEPLGSALHARGDGHDHWRAGLTSSLGESYKQRMTRRRGQVGGGEPHGGGVGGWVRGPGMILARKFTGSACVNADSLFVVGGQSVSSDGFTVRRERLSSAEVFRVTLEHPLNFEVESRLGAPIVSPWGDEPAMSEVRSGLGVAALNGFVYAVGGNNGEKRLCSGERLDCAARDCRQWTSLPHMRHARSNLCLVALAGKLYAIGGYDGAVRLRSVEAYDPCLNKWSRCADMHTGREGFGCAAVDMGGGVECIIAVGGFDGKRVLRSAELYDPVHDRWVLLPGMLQHPRAFLGLVSVQGLVFALGGETDSGAMLASVEVYGTAQQLSNAAIPVSSATLPRTGHAMHSSGNRFLMGAGHGGWWGGVMDDDASRPAPTRSFDGAAVEEGAPFWVVYEAMRLPVPMCNFAACIV